MILYQRTTALVVIFNLFEHKVHALADRVRVGEKQICGRKTYIFMTLLLLRTAVNTITTLDSTIYGGGLSNTLSLDIFYSSGRIEMS